MKSLLLALALLTFPAFAAKPNIVLILADDLGYGDVGCYNPDSKIPTPNLDRLATEGIRFTDSHAPTSVCTPTRYAILTGRYCWRSRLKAQVLGPWGKPLISADRLTLPQMLRQQGYATAMFGKWHLGMGWQTKDGKAPDSRQNPLSNVDFTKPITDTPIHHGFDYYFGVDVPNYPPYCFIENNHTIGIPDQVNRPEFNHPGPMLKDWQWVDIMPELTRRAVKYVDDSAKSPEHKPFFLYFPITAPHFPVVPAPEFEGKSKAGKFGDFVNQVDWTVGQVLDALKRNNLTDNTLVLFTSDNGPEITGEVNPGAYDRVQQYHHYSMGPLRGAKRDTWEGGHRVAFLARWPGGGIPAGATSDQLISHVDLMATCSALLDAKLPDTAAEDSFNILPALRNEKTDQPCRPALVHHAASGKFAIRRGDWVLINKTGDDNNKKGEPDWFKKERGYVDDDLPGQLFNVKEDLSERKNYYAEKPELVNELRALLEKYKQDGRSTPGAPQQNDTPVTNKIFKGPDPDA